MAKANDWQQLMTDTKQDTGDEGLTIDELIHSLGFGHTKTRKLINEWVARGRVTKGRGLRPDCAGRKQWVPVYKVVQP